MRSAHTHGFVHNEAIANERAGCFYASRGFEKIATTYLREARSCYSPLGRRRKGSTTRPALSASRRGPGDHRCHGTIQAPVEHLDLATVIKVSEAVSGEIVLERLIDTLMRTAIEHAGAERGLLILPRGDDYRIEAEATTGSDNVNVVLRQAASPQRIYRARFFSTCSGPRTACCLHDASGESPFAADEYIREAPTTVGAVPAAAEADQTARAAVPREQPHASRLHARPHGRPQVAGFGGGDLHGEHASLWRSPGARGAVRLVDSNIVGV